MALIRLLRSLNRDLTREVRQGVMVCDVMRVPQSPPPRHLRIALLMKSMEGCCLMRRVVMKRCQFPSPYPHLNRIRCLNLRSLRLLLANLPLGLRQWCQPIECALALQSSWPS